LVHRGPETVPEVITFAVVSDPQGAARAKTSGGRVLMEPHQVPGGRWILQGADPQGAHFALIASRR